MEKEAVATPVYFQQMDLKGQAALSNLSLVPSTRHTFTSYEALVCSHCQTPSTD